MEKLHSVPTLKELGVDESTMQPCLYPGGETEALRRMDEQLKKTVPISFQVSHIFIQIYQKRLNHVVQWADRYLKEKHILAIL